jgi:cardiolipin synthase A/B
MPFALPNFSWQFHSIVSFLLTLIFVSFILRSKKPPGSTWAWLLFIVIIPYVGIPAYIVFSGRKMGTKFQKKEALAPPSTRFNREARLITDGTEAYAKLVELIESARTSIHLATFIFSKDSVGESILALLVKKAEQGVAVRLLLDSFGSLWVRHPSFRSLVKAGGRVGYFMPLIHLPFRGRSNLRNHRKIVVVDSCRAILGGMNIATEYMGPTPNAQRWTDLGLKITGPSARDVDAVFIKDWEFATKEKIELQAASADEASSNPLQIVTSGPDVNGDPLYDALLTMIFKANKRIWVASPYFIPDESLARALQLASQRGVDVRVLIPEKSNHFMADLARGTYIRQLATANCQIRFLPKMIHAKAFLMDDSHAVVGSANFDMRSLLYNYEIGAFITSPNGIISVEKWFETCLSEAKDMLMPASFFEDLAEGIGRVLGPLI